MLITLFFTGVILSLLFILSKLVISKMERDINFTSMNMLQILCLIAVWKVTSRILVKEMNYFSSDHYIYIPILLFALLLNLTNRKVIFNQ
jgi:hypothetical protein